MAAARLRQHRAGLRQRPGTPAPGRGVVAAALVVLVAGALCLLLAGRLPWLVHWPDSWTLPATRWIGQGLGGVLDAIKPGARAVSALLAYPMGWARILLTATPWPILIGAVAAVAWRVGRWRLAILAIAGLGMVVASGYWLAGMNTLALIAVSVPLALAAGLLIGILAHEVPRLKAPVQTLLDVLQTVPTFAYLTPLLFLFGFGPVVGLLASAIYAAPPMARNVMLGLERVEPDIREAAVMSGGRRWQQLFLVELPSAAAQIMVGVNQALMAALSMVIIAAVIGGFDDIGWEVLMTMRKAEFGRSLVAGLVIVIFAVLIDRISGASRLGRRPGGWAAGLALLGVGVALTLALGDRLPASENLRLFDGAAQWIDLRLSALIASHGEALNAFKNGVMFYLLLPLRIGLDQAVMPFTWGFQWTAQMSAALFFTAGVAAAALAWRGRIVAGLVLLILSGVLETGVTQLPWPFVLIATGALGWVASGWRLGAACVLSLAAILLIGLWDKALLSVYLAGSAVLACTMVGGALGVLSAASPAVWRIMRPVCDMLQTIPLFVFLIPVLMFFQIGEFSAFLAICFYAVVPMIRYTRHGLVSTPDELIEAAVASGATPSQIMHQIRLPYATPAILLGLNQTILYAFAMLVIAALIGTTDLGQAVFLALGQADVGLGIAAGASMAILALIADRIVQGFAARRRAALGL